MISPEFKIVFVLAILLGSVSSRLFAAEGDTILNPAHRQESLDRAKKLLANREVPAVSSDPFHSQRFAEMVAGPRQVVAPVGVVVVARRTEHELLQGIAMSLKPNGNIVVGGERTLIFGQKKVKAGGILTITFEGTEYTLEITAIERTSFTLRLNREEFTRPIK